MATRRTRIVCISDTHNQTPKLPTGDILIHAGDLTNQGTYSELQKTVNWIQQLQFQVKIIIAGNHDITLDRSFYTEYGGYFHNKRMEDPQRCLDLFKSDPSIVFLNHEAKEIRIKHDGDLVSTLKVFGSPYSPAHGFWAFGYPTDTASQLWDQIPLDSDIIVAHTPAKFHLDECGKRGTAGCEVLRQTLWRVRPRLFVCGHIHEAYGVEVIEWDLSSSNVKCKEQGVRQLADPEPGSKKQFTVDLSLRARSRALRNDGSVANLTSIARFSKYRGTEVDGPADGPKYDRGSEWTNMLRGEQDGDATTRQDLYTALLPDALRPFTPPFPGFEKAERPSSTAVDAGSIKYLGTCGQGGSGSSARSVQEAISGRERRLETCVVNAAFMGSNWPHKGGKRFHKPIVIDLDLPALGEKDNLTTWTWKEHGII